MPEVPTPNRADRRRPARRAVGGPSPAFSVSGRTRLQRVGRGTVADLLEVNPDLDVESLRVLRRSMTQALDDAIAKRLGRRRGA